MASHVIVVLWMHSMTQPGLEPAALAIQAHSTSQHSTTAASKGIFEQFDLYIINNIEFTSLKKMLYWTLITKKNYKNVLFKLFFNI